MIFSSVSGAESRRVGASAVGVSGVGAGVGTGELAGTIGTGIENDPPPDEPDPLPEEPESLLD